MITDELLFRFINKETSNRENRLISDWLSRNPEQAVRLNRLKDITESADLPGSPEEILNNWHELDSKLLPKQNIIRNHPAISIRLARIAAVLLILIGSGLIWFYQSNRHVVSNNDSYTKSVFLPDGTQVGLGPGSKLVYGREFLEGVRLIKLTGEAYFDVTSVPGHSFTVIAGSARIKVIGTRFVVNAPRHQEEVEVSVKSGNVLFYNSENMDPNSFRMGLVAGEKGIFYTALNRMDKTKDPYFQSAP